MNEQSESLSPQAELEALRQQNRELKSRNQILEQLARKDELTGLDNRRSFEEEIRRAVSGAIRAKQPISIVFADIDLFKQLNDTYGHQAGDRVLQSVSAGFKDGIRDEDRACRYGGEEVVIILPNTSLNNAIGVSERLRHRTENSTIDHDGRQIKATASFGVSSFVPTDINTQDPGENAIGPTINKLVEDADQAMYGAKSAGRNRTGFINPEGKIGVLEKDPQNNSKMVLRLLKPAVPTLARR